MTAGPLVSVVLPAYRSQATIGGCLAALGRQSLADAEVIVVDSSPDGASADVVRRFPAVRLERTASRLFPQAARNLGVSLAHGTLLAFTDPDVYPAETWLERLVIARVDATDIVVGALACHGDRWLDVGVHLCKFSPWLPGGPPRPTDMAPTAGMLISRAAYEELGGFPGEAFQGDAVLAWRARRRGFRLRFEPEAVAYHHHLVRFGAFLGQRFRRGRELAALRAGEWGHSRARDAALAVASFLPLRLGRVLALTVGRCRRAGAVGDLARTLPVVVAGHVAGLAGEGLAFAGDLVTAAGRRRTVTRPV